MYKVTVLAFFSPSLELHVPIWGNVKCWRRPIEMR